MPKVSVIVPVYNVEKYLGECLDSVLRQTLKDIEIVCVDDGSTDSSAKILADYAAKDSRIKVVTQANAGLSAARNAGMDAASGEYVCFIDSDDWIVDDAMERCVAACDRDGLDQFVFGCSVMADENDGFTEKRRAREAKLYDAPPCVCGAAMPGTTLLLRMLGSGGYYTPVQLRVFRLGPLRKGGLRFPEGLIHEDEFFTPLSLMLASRAEIVSEKLYVRRLRPGSIMTAKTECDTARRLAHMIAIDARLRAALPAFARAHEGGEATRRLLAHIKEVLVSRRRRSGGFRALGVAAALPGAPARWRIAALMLELSARVFLGKARHFAEKALCRLRVCKCNGEKK